MKTKCFQPPRASGRRAASVLLAAMAALAAPSRATVYNLNTTAGWADDGKCGLQEALQAINTLAAVNTNDCAAGSAAANTINLQSGSFASPVVYSIGVYLPVFYPVEIRGGGIDRTVIASTSEWNGEFFSFTNEYHANQSTIRGVTLRKDVPGYVSCAGVSAYAQDNGNSASLLLVQTKVKGFSGSGIATYGVYLTLDSCSIEGNTSSGHGGGIHVANSWNVTGGLLMHASSVTGNTSGDGGGGLYYHADGNSNIYNVTFSGNTAPYGKGGGLLIDIPSVGYFNTYGCTIVNNTAAVSGGGIANLHLAGTPPYIIQGLVAKNTAPSGKDVSGWVGNVDALFGDYTGNTAPQGPGIVTPVADPKIGALAESGWPLNIKMIPIASNSPALDKTPDGSTDLVGKDGRGFRRPVDGNSNGTVYYDLGAYEYDPLRRETEALSFVKSSDAHNVFTSDPEYASSGGTHLAANAVDDYVSYNFPIPATGTYNVKVRLKKNNNRAIFRLATADSPSGTYTNVGGTQDMYSTSIAFAEVNIGSVTFSSTGTKSFRFRVTGKNAASSGYNMYFDHILLTKL